MSLTLDEVRQIRFRMTRRGELGYQVVDVDTFIDRVEATFDEMEKERERLRREVDSAQNTAVSPAVVTDDSALREAVQEKDNEISGLRGEVQRLTEALTQGSNASAAQQAAEQRVRELTAQNDQLRNQLDQVRAEYDRARSERVTSVGGGPQTLTVTSSEEAAPAVTRLLQMATDQATTLVNEAQTEAQRKIGEAELRANEIKTDARTKAERVESEARVNAEQMTREAESRAAAVDQQANQRRNELFADLEREQHELAGKVSSLRTFETSFRENLTGTLSELLATVTEAKAEPADVPELARPASDTPRLDALAGEQG